MTTFKFKIVCPVCQDQLEYATAMTGDEDVAVKPGDVTICGTCASLLEFDDELNPRLGNIEDLDPDDRDLVVATIAHIQNRSTLH